MSDYEPRVNHPKKVTKLNPLEKMKKFDQDKPDLSLIPAEALNEISYVLAFGAAKYGRDNWRTGTDWTRVVSSVLRHVYSWVGGESRDPESGRSHLAHAACGIMFLLFYETKSVGRDDRPKK